MIDLQFDEMASTAWNLLKDSIVSVSVSPIAKNGGTRIHIAGELQVFVWQQPGSVPALHINICNTVVAQWIKYMEIISNDSCLISETFLAVPSLRWTVIGQKHRWRVIFI